MHIVAVRFLRAFWEKHPDAEQALKSWVDEVKKASWSQPAQIKEQYWPLESRLRGFEPETTFNPEYDLEAQSEIWHPRRMPYPTCEAAFGGLSLSAAPDC